MQGGLLFMRGRKASEEEGERERKREKKIYK